MNVHDLSTLEGIAAEADRYEEKASRYPDQKSYNAAWLHGYAEALKTVAKQFKPIESVAVLVCTYENHHGHTLDISMHPTSDAAFSCVNAIKRAMGYNEDAPCDDEIFDFDVHTFSLKNVEDKENMDEK